MKVIAIKDSPKVPNAYYHNGICYDRAYYKGDIFELDTSSDWGFIIYHDKLNVRMDANPDNFITLDEFRSQKLKQLGI